MKAKGTSFVVCASALLCALLVNTVGSARAEFFADLSDLVADKMGIEPNIGSLKVNFYVYSDNPKTGDLQLWIKWRDWSIYKTINYATAKKYIGKHDGESYALAPQFVFAPASRNLITDSFQACVKTIATGEQLCTTHYWLPNDINVQRVYMEAYSSGYS